MEPMQAGAAPVEPARAGSASVEPAPPAGDRGMPAQGAHGRGLRSGLVQLRDLLLAAPDGVPLGRLRLHRAVAWLLPALAAVVLAAAGLRLLSAGAGAEREWYGFGFLDERWRVARYWGCVIAALFVPLATVRPRCLWPAEAPAASALRAARVRMAVALAATCLWLGPPWNLALLERPMEWHEIVHLGPLQALLSGKAFYTESGTQYAPGLQLLSLLYLDHFGVSLLSFREFWLWTNLAGGLVLVAWMARLFGPLATAVGLVALRVLSPFYFFRAVAGGTYEFAYGSASCIRYAGAVHAVLAVACAFAATPTPSRRVAARRAAALLLAGAVFGVFVQLGQENLGCGVAGLALLSAFARLSGACSARRVFRLLAVFGAGAVLALLPALAWFASEGRLGAALRRYFEVGVLVARGYSNTPFAEPWLSPQGILYLALPAVAVLVFAVAAFDAARARRDRFAAAGAAIATLACFATALLRTDRSHILAAATPAALLAAAAVEGLRARAAAPAARVVLAAALVPFALCLQAPQAKRFLRDATGRPRALLAADAQAERVGRRVGYRFDLDAPYAVFSKLSLREFLDVTARLHELVGRRPVVISSAIGTRGHWYFFADLEPWTADPEPSMTVLNDRMRAHYLDDLAHRGIPCLISTRPEDAEVRMARSGPAAREEWLVPTRERTFLVSCAVEHPALSRVGPAATAAPERAAPMASPDRRG